MPERRPSTMMQKKKAAKPFEFGFIKKFKQREEERKNEEAMAAMEACAESENKMIEILTNVNFNTSKLPYEDLHENMSEAKPNMCDLEFRMRTVIAQLNATRLMAVDLKKDFDAALIALCMEFEQAVANGERRTAYASLKALEVCIIELRSQIPNTKEDQLPQFLEDCAAYVANWQLIVDSSRRVDMLEGNLDATRAKLQGDEAKLEAEKKKLFERLAKDGDFRTAYATIRDMDSDAKMTPVQVEARKALMKQNMGKVQIELTSMMLYSQEALVETKTTALESLKNNVVNLPVKKDPNERAKQLEAMEALKKSIAENFQEIDEMLNDSEVMAEALRSLQHSAGAEHLSRTLADQAEETLREMKERQEKKLHVGGGVELADLGLYTPEELEALEKQMEQQQAVLEAQQAAEIHDEEDQQVFAD